MSDGEINVDSIDGEVLTSANIVGQLYPQGEKGDKGDKGDRGDTGFSPIIETSKVGKTTTITITDAEGTKTATILDGADGQGSGDMRTEVYDINHNGIVDDAEKVNGHTVAKDVPADAEFTDTTYTAGTGIDITNGVITNTQTSAEWGNITGTLSDQTDLKDALDLKSDLSYVNGKIGDLSNLTTKTKSNVVSAINEVNSKENGIIKTHIEVNKFLKLFTLQFTSIWKSSSVYFTFTNVQDNTFSQLINLYARRDDTTTTITNFSCLSHTGNLKSDLVAVITDSNTVEVYYKCYAADSPALNIIANPKMNANITTDMETLVTTLPTGTATYVSDTKVGNSTLWDGLTRDTATENNADTWIAVIKDDKIQHTTIDSIVSRGIKSKNVSGTPDSNGFIPLGLSITNVVLGFTNNAGARFILPFYENNANRITAQIMSWDKTPITAQVSFTVYYI